MLNSIATGRGLVTVAGTSGLFKHDVLSQFLFQCPVDTNDSNMVWFENFSIWVGVIYFLSSLWITRHIWIPKSQRMAPINQIFGRPFYSGTRSYPAAMQLS